MPIKTLYIHGLDSSPKKGKLKIIQAHSEVIGLHIDYHKEEDPFTLLDDTIAKENITHIIGSSLGGFLGFWLAEKNKLPCLLFNPVLGNRKVDVPVKRTYNSCPKRIIIIGEQDQTVLPYSTIEYLRTFKHTKTNQQIILDSTMEHRISETDFKKYVDYYFGK